MKKFASVLLSSAVVASMCTVAAMSASADVEELPADWDPTQYTYTVVGDANLLGDASWDPTNDDYNMTYDENANLWYINLNGVGNLGEQDFDYGAQYKVVVRDYDASNPWEFSFNENGVAFGYDSNSTVDFGETAETAKVVTIIFDGQKTTSRIDQPYAPATEHTYFAVGDANLFDPAWDPTAFEMSVAEDGLYKVTIPVTEDQCDNAFEYKVAQDGKWDVSYNDEGLATGDGTNAIGYIEPGTKEVVITFDASTGKAGFYCVAAAEEPTEATDPTNATEATDPTNATEATDPTNATDSTDATVATDSATSATNATNATNATTSGTAATNATTTNRGTVTNTTSGNTTSTATGKVATGDSTSVAVLLGTLMLAGAAVVVARKKISQ